MLEDCSITLHDVTKCGYQPRAAETIAFGNLQELLEDIVGWARNKTLGETNLIAKESGGEGTYLLDARVRLGRYLLTLWNAVPATQGQVASVRKDAGVGEATAVMNDIQEGTIPGFATYFYFMPARNQVAGVRFQHRSWNHYAMVTYLKAFLRYNGRHTVFAESKPPGADVGILGYAQNGRGRPQRLRPVLRTAPSARDSETAMLVREAPRITKIVRKTDLDLGVAETRAVWQQLLQLVHLRPAARPAEPVRLQFMVEGKVSSEEVRSVIADWEVGAFGEEEWEDVGFVLGGETGKTHWLSHSLARTRLQIEVRRDDPEVANPESLIRQLVQLEADILQRLV